MSYRLCTAAGPDGELPEALQKLEPAILELVCNEIVEAGGHVQWDDIAGQDQAKRLVQELVVWPMLNPHLFKVSLLMPKHACCMCMLHCVDHTLHLLNTSLLYACCQASILYSASALGTLPSLPSVRRERWHR